MGLPGPARRIVVEPTKLPAPAPEKAPAMPVPDPRPLVPA